MAEGEALRTTVIDTVAEAGLGYCTRRKQAAMLRIALVASLELTVVSAGVMAYDRAFAFYRLIRVWRAF